MKIVIKTYGCTANQFHSEVIRGIINKVGIKTTNDITEADIVIFNTCIVKEATENKIADIIARTSKLGKKIIVTGCGADYKYFRERIKKINSHILFVSSHRILDIVKAISKDKSILETRVENKLNERVVRTNKVIGIVEISQGCLGNCSFCATKIARGTLKSYPLADICRAVKRYVKEGCKEIRITSQDNACYGFDINTNIVELLRNISRIEGDFMIRVGMMNPVHVKRILTELVNIYKNQKVYKFLHLPVQSGSDKVLSLIHI